MIGIEMVKNLAVGGLELGKQFAGRVAESELAKKVGERIVVSAAGVCTTLGIKKLASKSKKEKKPIKVTIVENETKEVTAVE